MDKVNDFIAGIKLESESWVPVKDFETRFWISDHGRIVSHDHRKNIVHLLRTNLDQLGYYATQLRQKPRNRKVRVHTLVAEHFLPPPPPNMPRPAVNHKDGVKTNNHVSNLEVISSADNIRHACAMGLFNIKGSKHPLAKLKECEVLTIRAMRGYGVKQKVIGWLFGVSREQVRDIVNRKMWQHI